MHKFCYQKHHDLAACGKWQKPTPVPDKPARKGFDIYSVALQDGRCGPLLHPVHDINSDESEASGSIAADGTIYFMKNGAE